MPVIIFMSIIIILIVIMIPFMFREMSLLGKVKPSENTAGKWVFILSFVMAGVLAIFLLTGDAHLSKYALLSLFASLYIGISNYRRAFIEKSVDGQ